MRPTGEGLTGFAGRLLEPGEREAVMGDLEESGEAGWRGLPHVLGLALRRQAALWKGWRPWCAAFGLALPQSFLFMGASLSVYVACGHIVQPGGAAPSAPATVARLAVQLLLLVGGSWSGGFLVGSFSRRTLWASVALTAAPCLFCLGRFHVPSVSPVSLLLFLGPATWGVVRGLRPAGIGPRLATAVAALVTLLAIAASSEAGRAVGTTRGWTCNSLLSLPAWLLLATAWARQRRPRPREAG